MPVIGADQETARDTREIMERQITHMVRLIDDLLDASRINRNRWGQDGDKERSREAGCDGHLVKPVDIDELEKLLVRRRP
jgi:hypothetical protein